MSETGAVIAGRYRLGEQIGQGGMGQVFRAVDETLSREVAVKILLPQYAVQEPSRQRFIREAKVTATLRHPSAIRVYDFGADGERLYLVMELLAGETLRSRLTERHQLPLEEAIEIAYQIADVLVAAHDLPLIHRDLKPENIMLEPSASGATVKVLDFGMAFIADNEVASEQGMGRLTKEGLAGGTPAYMSPEQIQGANVGAGADVYALGCVLFESLAGRPPFEGPMMKLLTKQMYQPAPDLRPFCPEAPQALVELVDRLLAKNALDRPSAETVRTRLAALKPLAAGTRERTRDEAFLLTREARMVSAPVIEPPVAVAPPRLGVSLIGEISSDLELALAATEIAIKADNPDVVFVTHPKHVDLAELCAESSVPVVVASPSTEVEAVSKLLRAGVSEIVSSPPRSDELARKLRRAARKKR